MKQVIKILFAGVCLLNGVSMAFAAKYWTPDAATSNWDLHINNGVIYISSSDFPEHCSNSRAQINIANDAPLDRALYAYLLAAYQAKQAIRIVVDSNETTCKVAAADSR